MNHDISFLQEAWDGIKPFINSKERAHAAEALIRLFDEYTDLSEVTDHLEEFDKVMRNALTEHFELYDDSDDDEEL